MVKYNGIDEVGELNLFHYNFRAFVQGKRIPYTMNTSGTRTMSEPLGRLVPFAFKYLTFVCILIIVGFYPTVNTFIGFIPTL